MKTLIWLTSLTYYIDNMYNKGRKCKQKGVYLRDTLITYVHVWPQILFFYNKNGRTKQQQRHSSKTRDMYEYPLSVMFKGSFP